jgi:hypothetical protein
MFRLLSRFLVAFSIFTMAEEKEKKKKKKKANVRAQSLLRLLALGPWVAFDRLDCCGGGSSF